MKSESCPNPEELRSFVRCNVSEQQADSIAEHLEQCPACEETVVGLERDPDTIAERIKQAAAQPTFAHEPECQQLLQSLLNGTTSSLPEPSNVEPPFQIDQILRDYQIVTKLGEGGMATTMNPTPETGKVAPSSAARNPRSKIRFMPRWTEGAKRCSRIFWRTRVFHPDA